MGTIITSAVQTGGWASRLFSSALFCLWLSLASVMVWFDLDPAQAPATATGHPALTPATDVPAAAPAGDTPATGRAADIA